MPNLGCSIFRLRASTIKNIDWSAASKLCKSKLQWGLPNHPLTLFINKSACYLYRFPLIAWILAWYAACPGTPCAFTCAAGATLLA